MPAVRAPGRQLPRGAVRSRARRRQAPVVLPVRPGNQARLLRPRRLHHSPEMLHMPPELADPASAVRQMPELQDRDLPLGHPQRMRNPPAGGQAPRADRSEREMSGFDNREGVRAKIEWEGGLMGALDYGISVNDMPEGDDELVAAWGALETAYRALAPLDGAVE